MKMTAPTWKILLARLSAGPAESLTGSYSIIRPRRDDGHGWPPPESVGSTDRFAYRPTGQWRLETSGYVSFVGPDADLGEPGGLSFSAGLYPWDFPRSP